VCSEVISVKMHGFWTVCDHIIALIDFSSTDIDMYITLWLHTAGFLLF